MAEAGAGNNRVDEMGSTDDELTPPRLRGLTPRGERWLDRAGWTLIALFAAAWTWSGIFLRDARADGLVVATASSRVASALTGRSNTSTAYLTDAALRTLASRLRGTSGKLSVQTALPGDTLGADSLPPGARIVYQSEGEAVEGAARPATPGIRRVAVAVGTALTPIANLNLITLTPFSAKQRGRIGTYLIGSWPAESGARGPAKAPADRYANPRGFIEVTAANQDTRVSEHFRLRDFLTKGQQNVWPKYLVLEMRLVDKLELVLSDLAAKGINVGKVTVLSGFRTPSYNEGGGNTSGRADLSRHMFGDAADVFVDNDGNGTMDDLNGDGAIDTRDVRVILDAVDRVERAHPELIGGAGVYPACCGHGPFIHIDTRGYRARW